MKQQTMPEKTSGVKRALERPPAPPKRSLKLSKFFTCSQSTCAPDNSPEQMGQLRYGEYGETQELFSKWTSPQNGSSLLSPESTQAPSFDGERAISPKVIAIMMRQREEMLAKCPDMVKNFDGSKFKYADENFDGSLMVSSQPLFPEQQPIAEKIPKAEQQSIAEESPPKAGLSRAEVMSESEVQSIAEVMSESAKALRAVGEIFDNMKQQQQQRGGIFVCSDGYAPSAEGGSSGSGNVSSGA